MIKKIALLMIAGVSLQASAITLSPMTLEKDSKNNKVMNFSLGDNVCVSKMWAKELTIGDNAIHADNNYICAEMTEAGPNILEVTDLYGKAILVDSVTK